MSKFNPPASTSASAQSPTAMNTSAVPTKKQQGLALLFGGLLPVIAFAVIEDQYGIIAGLIAGMIFSLGEVAYELIRYRKVSGMTWAGNGLILIMGGISLISQDGLWFKLQPAIFEFAFGVFLLFSGLLKKPFLVLMIEKQNPEMPIEIKQKFKGINFRVSIFFFIHAVIATYAALYWSTWAWAMLKGVGFMGSFFVYMIFEMLFLRRSLRPRR